MNRRTPKSLLPGQRFDPGRTLARLLCLVFAMLGALPLSAGFIVRSDVAQRWVSEETSRLLERLLGLEASYSVEVNLLPLEVALHDVRVESEDGGSPALQAERVSITPRVFSLIAGRLDIGDIAIERAEHRLVIQDGRLVNLQLKLPERSGPSPELEHAPFRSLSATDMRFEIEIDGVAIESGAVDLDVFTDDKHTLELALRIGESRIAYPDGLFQSTRPDGLPGPEWFWDEDVLCSVDARLRVDQDGVLVRRLSVLGSVDIDAEPGTEPRCPLSADEAPGLERVELRTSQLRIVTSKDGGFGQIEGSIESRAPVNLLNRLTGGAPTFDGWTTLSGDLRYEPSMRIPEFDGRLTTGQFLLAGRRLVYDSEADVRVEDGKIVVPHLHATYGGGPVDIYDVTLSPLEPGMPLRAKKVDGSGVPFQELMRDIGVTPNTIVQWHIDRAIVSDFGGTLLPVQLDGSVLINTSRFEIFDRAVHDPERQHMVGANPKAVLSGRFGVRDDSVRFDDMDVRFGKSHMKTTVHLGFSDWIYISIPESSLDLSELSPLVTMPLSGIATMSAEMDGKMSDPTLRANLEIDDLVFSGFPLGDLQARKTVFKPLQVELSDGHLVKGRSRFELPHALVQFDANAAVKVDMDVDAQGADIRDLLAMWRFDEDPRWKDLAGQLFTESRVRYVLAGPQDACGEGNLRIDGHANVHNLTLFEEEYDRAEADFKFQWRDPLASYHGMSLALPNFRMNKAGGSLLGTVEIGEGAKIQGDVVATAIPIGELSTAKEWASLASGTVSAVGRISGSLDEMEARVRASVSPVILGRSRLPGSNLDIHLKPLPTRGEFAAERTRCGNRVPVAADPKQQPEDRATGVFHIAGQLFGQQVMFDKFSITRQQHKVAKGGILFNDFNLGPLLELRPEMGLAKQRPAGKLSGRLDLARMPLDDIRATQAVAEIGTLWVSWRGFRVSSEPLEALTLSSGTLTTPRLSLHIATPKGREAVFDVTGAVENVTSAPTLNLDLQLRPVDLQSWAMLLPGLSDVSGMLQGQVQLRGSVAQPEPSGSIKLADGRFALRQQGLSFGDVNLEVALEPNGLSLERASAEVGGGTLSASGRLPLRGAKIGEFRGRIEAREVALPVTDGVELALDADLDATWQPSLSVDDDQAALPKVTGRVSLRSFEYSRPVTMNADLASLTRRGKRTEFESYDPRKDFVELDVSVRSDRALRLNNNLIDANLRLERPGLQLTGTNQRFGLRGRMRIERGGRIRLRRNEFEVESGEVRFDDATTIAPRVDLRAVTEYRRYSTSTSTAVSGASAGGGPDSNTAGGQWRIAMHAHGDADNLKIDLTSQPKLSQDDIFLLLTVGLTRAELDQAQSASLGESVALEALGSLTGADSAVTDAIPVIDEFRFGSSYSSRTGRTEPTVTVGKRLTERIRAFVTSGISESREVRSNLEWRLNRQLSVEGSYDNVNDISSSSLGNLGADIRWRLEFR